MLDLPIGFISAAALCLLVSVTTEQARCQSYVLDDGTPETLLAQDAAFATHAGAMQGFTVPGGGTDVIESVSVVTTPFSYSANAPSTLGTPLWIAVWDDPNGDKNPDDAVHLGSFSGHTITSERTGQFATYEFPTPVPVSASFFVGIAVEVQFPSSAVITIDEGQGYRFDSWFYSNANGPVDLVNLSQNTIPPTNTLLTGRFLIRANDGDYGSAIGTDSCLSAPNSLGRRGLLAASGNLNAGTGPYRVHLTATWLPNGSAGFFLASQTQVPSFNVLNSNGRLCLGGTILRIGPSLSTISGGMLSWDVDLGNVDSFGAANPGIDVVAAGQTWSFQAWHRDLDPGPTSNLTEAVTVTFM